MENIIVYKNQHYLDTHCYLSEEFLAEQGYKPVERNGIFVLYEPNIVHDTETTRIYLPLNDADPRLIDLFRVTVKHTVRQYEPYFWHLFLPKISEQTEYALLHCILKRKGIIETYDYNIAYAVIESDSEIALRTELDKTYTGHRLLVPVSKQAKVAFSLISKYCQIRAGEEWFNLFIPVIFDYQLDLIDKVVNNSIVFAIMYGGTPLYVEQSPFACGYALRLSENCYYIVLCPTSDYIYMGVTYALYGNTNYVWHFRIGSRTKPLTKLSLEKVAKV